MPSSLEWLVNNSERSLKTANKKLARDQDQFERVFSKYHIRERITNESDPRKASDVMAGFLRNITSSGKYMLIRFRRYIDKVLIIQQWYKRMREVREKRSRVLLLRWLENDKEKKHKLRQKLRKNLTSATTSTSISHPLPQGSRRLIDSSIELQLASDRDKKKAITAAYIAKRSEFLGDLLQWEHENLPTLKLHIDDLRQIRLHINSLNWWEIATAKRPQTEKLISAGQYIQDLMSTRPEFEWKTISVKEMASELKRKAPRIEVTTSLSPSPPKLMRSPPRSATCPADLLLGQSAIEMPGSPRHNALVRAITDPRGTSSALNERSSSRAHSPVLSSTSSFSWSPRSLPTTASPPTSHTKSPRNSPSKRHAFLSRKDSPPTVLPKPPSYRSSGSPAASPKRTRLQQALPF